MRTQWIYFFFFFLLDKVENIMACVLTGAGGIYGCGGGNWIDRLYMPVSISPIYYRERERV